MTSTALKDAIKEAASHAISATLALEVQELVAKETRRAFRERETQINAIVQAAVAEALAEIFNAE